MAGSAPPLRETGPIGIARAGSLTLPAREGLAYEFLDVAWRMIQHYGMEINGQRYNGAGLNLYRNVRSPYRGLQAGKWPVMVDTHDVRFVYFQDPDTQAAFHRPGKLRQPIAHHLLGHPRVELVRARCGGTESSRRVRPEELLHQLRDLL